MTEHPNTPIIPSGIALEKLVTAGLMTAVICVLGPFSLPIPFSPVPLSLTTLVIYLAVYILGLKLGTLCTVIYLLIGVIGLPVFSGFTGGPGKLLGPTGGYMAGYILITLITGLFLRKQPVRPFVAFTGMILGTAACYLLGTGWLAHQTDLDFGPALGIGVLPFVPGDIVKIICSIFLGKHIQKRLQKTGLLQH